MAGDPDYQPMKTELDALAAATAAIEAAVDLARGLTQTTSYENNTDIVSTHLYQASTASAEWFTHLDLTGKGVLKLCELASTTTSAWIEITIDGEIVYFVTQFGGLASGADIGSVALMADKETSWWKTGMNDAGNNRYSMFLKNEFYFMTSLKVRYRQIGGAGKGLGCNTLHRIRT